MRRQWLDCCSWSKLHVSAKYRFLFCRLIISHSYLETLKKSIVYGSARKSYLKCLDTIHHQGLRLALGAFRTSPVESLYAESNEPSLYTRREKLSLQYTTKLAANPKNPAHNCVFNPFIIIIIIHLRLLSLSV